MAYFEYRGYSMAKLIDSTSTIELTPCLAYPNSQSLICIVAIELNIEGNHFLVAFTPDRDGGILSLRECHELIHDAREYIRRIRDHQDSRENLSFYFFPIEGYFTIEMEDFDLPSDDEMNHNYVILTFSMSLRVFDSDTQTSLKVSASFHTDQVLAFIGQFEQEMHDLLHRVND